MSFGDEILLNFYPKVKNFPVKILKIYTLSTLFSL